MKLLNITSRYYVLSAVIIILLGGLISYSIISSIIDAEFNKKLFFEKEQLVQELKAHGNLKQTFYLNVGDKIEIIPVADSINISSIISDTVMFDSYAGKDLPFRKLYFTTEVGGSNYGISIYKSLFSNEELLKGIGKIMVFLLIGILISVVVLNRYILGKLMEPFYNILKVVKQFNIESPFKRHNEKTKVEEFQALEEVIGSQLDKNRRDYLSLKEFTENSAHEFQTPLSIIKTKSELLLQSGSLSEQQLEELNAIYSSARRLSRLNQGLTLLAKIDNNQFSENQRINVKRFLLKGIENIKELASLKNLKITTHFKAEPELILNQDLAYILFSNLLNNAIKHNVDEGFIEIKVHENEVVILNSGNDLNSIDPESLFERFKKSEKHSDSPGLGLSIVKRICEQYRLGIHYSFKNNEHKISIQF